MWYYFIRYLHDKASILARGNRIDKIIFEHFSSKFLWCKHFPQIFFSTLRLSLSLRKNLFIIPSFSFCIYKFRNNFKARITCKASTQILLHLNKQRLSTAICNGILNGFYLLWLLPEKNIWTRVVAGTLQTQSIYSITGIYENSFWATWVYLDNRWWFRGRIYSVWARGNWLPIKLRFSSGYHRMYWLGKKYSGIIYFASNRKINYIPSLLANKKLHQL